MTVRISGWKRIGIIASVVWMLVAGSVTFKVTSDDDLRFAALIYSQCAATRDEMRQNESENCDSKASRSSDFSAVFNKCMEDFKGQYPDTCSARSTEYAVNALNGERIAAILAALVPVPLWWGFAYLILFLVRWVKRGFSP